MIFENKIQELSDVYLADVHAPDITGFVDQLFHVAAKTGAVACVMDCDKRLRFFVAPSQARTRAIAPAQAPCLVEHAAAKAVLRMMCARLSVVCKERAATDVSPYGGQADVDYEVQDQGRWHVSFSNTAERQCFLIEALGWSVGEELVSGEEREAIQRATRRDAEMTSGAVTGRTHEEAMRAARQGLVPGGP